jgi:hypothetical protein
MKKRDLRHIGIYQDKNGRSVLYNSKKKEGYIIPENEVNRVATLQYRGYLALSIAIVLFFLFDIEWWIVLLIYGVLVLALEFIYRNTMLASYSIVTNYIPLNVLDKSIDTYKQKPGSLLSRVALYAVLGILMIMTIWGKPLTTADTQIIIVVAAFALINSIYHLFVYFKIRK